MAVKNNFLFVLFAVMCLITGCQSKPETGLPATPAALAQIRIIMPSSEMQAGQDMVLETEGIDMRGNTVEINPVWSCGQNGRINPTTGKATVFTAVLDGQCAVMAEEDGIQESVVIGITTPELYDIDVIPVRARIPIGQNLVLTAQGTDEKGKPVVVNPVWSSSQEARFNPSIGVTTVFESNTEGTYTVFAIQGKIVGKSIVDVVSLRPSALTDIKISADKTEISVGESVNLTARGVNDKGEPVDISPSWSSAGKGTFSAPSGESVVFKPASTGQYVISAQQNDVSSDITINVLPLNAVKFLITPDSVDSVAGATQTFTVKGVDADDNEVDVRPNWFSSGTGKVSPAAGKTITFQATSAGQYTLSAEQDGLRATANINVSAAGLAIIRIEPANARVVMSKTLILRSIGADIYGNQVTIKPAWTTDPPTAFDVPQVTWTFIGYMPGTYKIFATDGGIIGTTTVEVTSVPLLSTAGTTSIFIKPDKVIRMAVGDTINLTAEGYDNAGRLADITPMWACESKGGVAPISGLETVFTANQEGTCVVTVKDDEAIGRKTIYIRPKR